MKQRGGQLGRLFVGAARGAGGCEKQIPGGNDRKKGKGKNGRQQVPRCARNDNFFQKLSKKGKGNAKSNRNRHRNGSGSGNGEGEGKGKGEGKLGGGFEVEGG
jgi:hypothetical protein